MPASRSSTRLQNVALTEQTSNSVRFRVWAVYPILLLLFAIGTTALIFAMLSYTGHSPFTGDIAQDRLGYSSVRVATTEPIFGTVQQYRLSNAEITFAVDGVTVNDGDAILIKNETNPQLNGIYTFTNRELIRRTDMNASGKVNEGNPIYVQEGQTNGQLTFMVQKKSSGDGALDPVTGYGVSFESTTKLLLSIENVPPGYSLLSSDQTANGIEWDHHEDVTLVDTGAGLTGGPIIEKGTISLADQPANSIMANATIAAAPPTGLAMIGGDLLTHDGNTLVTLPAGTAGRVLSTNGPGVAPSWIATSGTGTVTQVGTGTGITGGPITTTGTVSFASIGARSFWANSMNVSAVPSQLQISAGEILSATSTALTKIPAGTEGYVLKAQATGSVPQWAPSMEMYTLRYTVASGVSDAAGTAATWNIRQLNTINDVGGHGNATRTGNTFTLQPGIWLIEVSAPAYRTDAHMLRLVTGGSPVALGTSEYASNTAQSGQNRSFLVYAVSLVAATTYTIEHYITTIGAVGIPLGRPAAIAGTNETYTIVKLIHTSV